MENHRRCLFEHKERHLNPQALFEKGNPKGDGRVEEAKGGRAKTKRALRTSVAKTKTRGRSKKTAGANSSLIL